MNKKIFVTIALLAFALFSSKAVAEMGYIDMSLNKTKEISPDMAEIVISVETSNKSSKIATDENKKISTDVYSKVEALINESNGDYIKTSNYSLSPRSIYKDGKSIFDKYVVSNSITVYTKDLDVVSKLIDTAIQAGATNVSNLNFSVSDYDDVCAVMISDLSRKSKAQASKIASAMGTKVKGIRSLDTRCSVEGAYPRAMYSMNLKSDAAGVENTPIQKGKVKINASINASFFVK